MWFPTFVWSVEMLEFLFAVLLVIGFCLNGYIFAIDKDYQKKWKTKCPLILVGGSIYLIGMSEVFFGGLF